jgi:outer membrane protein assembly factor BamB
VRAHVVAILAGLAGLTVLSAGPHALAAGSGDRRSGPDAGAPIAPPLLAEVWRADLGRALGRAIALEDTLAFAATLDGRIGAVGLASGRRVWRIRRGGAVPGGVVVEGQRVLGSTDEPEGRLYCLDAATGDPLWIADVGAAVGVPLVHGPLVLSAGLRGRVTACNLESGEIIWQRPVPGQIRAPLAVAAGLVLAPTLTDTLLALSAGTGDFAWGASPGGAVYGRPLVDGQGVWTLSYEGVLTCWEPATGALVRRAQLDGTFRSGVVRAGDALVAVATGGRVIAVDAATLALRWQVDLGGAAPCEPLADGDLLWVALGDRSLRAVRLSDGREAGRHELARPPTAGPIRAGDLLLVGLASGELVGLRVGLPDSVAVESGRLDRGGAGLPFRARGPFPSGPGLAAGVLGGGVALAAPRALMSAAAPASPTLIDGREEGGPRLAGWGRAWAAGWVAGTGVALWLQHEAEQAHDRYEATGDPHEQREAFKRAERFDRAVLAVWVASEAMFVLFVRSWLGGER